MGINHASMPYNVHLGDDKHKKVSHRSTESFPLEVVTLLEVLSRIEARRQAKLYAARKVVG